MGSVSRRRLFYSGFLPVAVALNLTFGLVILDDLGPQGWLGGLELATGAFSHQVAAWRQMTDAIFGWMEETPPSAEALQRLKGSLDDVLKQPASS